MRGWVEGVLSQTAPETASATLAVLWNGGSIGQGPVSGRHFASAPLAVLLVGPLSELGSSNAEFDAVVCAHATVGKLADYLWEHTRPTEAEINRIVAFCLSTSRSTQGDVA